MQVGGRELHIYTARVAWQGGWRGLLRTGSGVSVEFAVQPEQKGLPAAHVLTAQEAFVGAIAMEFMCLFLIHAKKSGVSLQSCECDGNGILDFAQHRDMFTRVVLHPHIIVERAEDIPLAEQAVEAARRFSTLAGSVRATVVVEHRIDVRGTGDRPKVRAGGSGAPVQAQAPPKGRTPPPHYSRPKGKG